MFCVIFTFLHTSGFCSTLIGPGVPLTWTVEDRHARQLHTASPVGFFCASLLPEWRVELSQVWRWALSSLNSGFTGLTGFCINTQPVLLCSDCVHPDSRGQQRLCSWGWTVLMLMMLTGEFLLQEQKNKVHRNLETQQLTFRYKIQYSLSFICTLLCWRPEWTHKTCNC